jgi:hypothetical protein
VRLIRYTTSGQISLHWLIADFLFFGGETEDLCLPVADRDVHRDGIN